MHHLENNDTLSVLIDDYNLVSEGGIVLTKTEQVLNGEKQRKATVYSAPAKYTIRRPNPKGGLKEILADCPVKAGDRVLLDKFAGVKTMEIEGKQVSIVRVHEIIAVLEDE